MKENSSKKVAVTASIILAILFVLSLCIILFSTLKKPDKKYIANIYSGGALVQTVDLSEGIPLTFTIGDENAGFNEIKVTSDGKIGVTRASCPDKLCIHQGFLASDTIPIVCLPNRLTIVIQTNDTYDNAPDVMTYD